MTCDIDGMEINIGDKVKVIFSDKITDMAYSRDIYIIHTIINDSEIYMVHPSDSAVRIRSNSVRIVIPESPYEFVKDLPV